MSRLLPINIEVEIVTKSPEAHSNRTAEMTASESTSAAAARLAQESKTREAAAAAADAAAASQARLLQGTGRETLVLDCQHMLEVAATAASLGLSL